MTELTPEQIIERLKQMEKEVPPDVEPIVKDAWQRYVDARINDERRKAEILRGR